MKYSLFYISAILITLNSCYSSKKSAQAVKESLDGNWEVIYLMSASSKPFNELFPNGNPNISFDTKTNRVNGFSGCNNFNGSFSTSGNQFKFMEEMAVTPKTCYDAKEGEQAFFQALKKTDGWSITKNIMLNLDAGNITVMRLNRK